MRELARIQFRGDARPFIVDWNARSSLKIEQRVVALYKDEPVYENMRRLFDTFARQHSMSWIERVEVEYSEEELISYDLLTLHVTGRAGIGNDRYADVYTRESACQACGRIRYYQAHNMVLDFSAREADTEEIQYFSHDFCETDFYEVIVSDKVKVILNDNQVRGVVLRPVENISTSIAPSRVYYQLLVESQIGPLVPPSRIQRLEQCETCGQYKQVLLDAWPGSKESEFYFLRSDYRGDQIVRTSDQFGRVPNYASKFLISRYLYCLLKEHDITGFWVQPAHLVY